MRAILGATLCLALTTYPVCSEQVDWNYYHKTDEILDFLRGTARKAPTKARYEDLQDPSSQSRLPVLTITDFASGLAGKEVLLLVAGEHARELITAEIIYWLIGLLTGERAEDFAEWAATQPVQATAWKNGWTKGTLQEWGQELLKKVVFKIFPIQNIAGRKSVESGTICLRKTISGVDLNRNWPYAWQKSPEGEIEFGGAQPLSEAETRIVKMVAENTQPQAYVNLHSGEWAMYVPWDSQKSTAPTLPADMGDLMEKMNAFCACMKGAAGEVSGYLAQGTSMDWMYAEQHVAYPLTFEVYGPKGLGKLAQGGHPRRHLHSAEQDKQPRKQQMADASCIEAFNPTNQDDYESTIAGWIGTLLVLAEHLASHPHATSASLAAEQEQLPEPTSPPSKQELQSQGEEIVRRAHDSAVITGFPVPSRDLGRKAADGLHAKPRHGDDGAVSASTSWRNRFIYGALASILGSFAVVAWIRLRPSLMRQPSFGKSHRREKSFF